MTPPRRSRRRTRGRSRRWVLRGLVASAVGGGIWTILGGADAFTSGTVARNSSANVATDDSAILGLLIADTVKRNQRALLAEITNNGLATYTLAVSLDDPTQGTLYGPNGSGETVTLTLDPGATGSVDIETSEKKGTTIPFTISRSAPEFSFAIHRQTTAEAGNTEGLVTIDKLSPLKVDAGNDLWTVKDLAVSSEKYDLDSIDLVVEEVETDDIVGTLTYDDIEGQTFTRNGTGNTPGVEIEPDDDSYNVTKKTTYRLTVTAYDTDSNFDRETRTK